VTEQIGRTLDIRPKWAAAVRGWLKVVRRLQAAGSKTRGVAILHIAVMIDESGAPLCWSEPKMTRIEPTRSAKSALETVLAALDPSSALDTG